MSKKLFIILLAILFIWNIILSVELYNQSSKPSGDMTVINNTVEGFSTDLTEVFNEVKSSIVTVDNNGILSSGFIYASDVTTYIITANHGINNVDNIYVIFDNGIRYKANYIGGDEKSDIAVLGLELSFDVSPLNLGDASYLSEGEFLISFGTAGAIEYKATASLALLNDNECVVERTIRNDEGYSRYYQTIVQLTSTINPGISGGPVVNMAGDVVAVNLMSDEEASGVLLAMSINEVKLVADSIINKSQVTKQEFGIKGSSINELENYEKSALGISLDIIEGYYVEDIIDESFASEIGLMPGDIITMINEYVIADYTDIMEVQYQTIENYNFTVIRANETINLTGANND